MKRILDIALCLILLALVCPPASMAQLSDELKTLKKEVDELKESQKKIQKELQEIKSLLRGRQALPAETRDVVVSVEGEPFRGDKNAKLTLVEFSDYQCPFCARHLSQTLPEIERDYIATGKVRYVFRDFPITSLHPQAFKAHEAARCAGEQGKYWEMHDRLFANQKALGPKQLSDHARSLGLDLPSFQQCLDGGKYAAKVRKGMSDGRTATVKGTPTFFLGFTEADDLKVKAVRVIRGAQPYAAFKEAIESLLSGEK